MAIDVITLRASKTYTEETARGVGAIQGQPGEKGDSGEGVPEGGTTGQVLVKKSEVDFDTEWQTQQADTANVDDSQISDSTTWSSQKVAFEIDKANTSFVQKKDLLLFSGEKATIGDITLMDSIYNYDELIVFTHVTASNVEDGFITSLVINKHEYVTGYSTGFNKTYMLNTSTASNDRRAVFGFVDEYTIRICELSKGTTLISVYGIRFEEANQGTSDTYEIVTCDIADMITEASKFTVSNFSKTFAETYVNITNGKDVILKANYAAENYVYLLHPSMVNNAMIAFSTATNDKVLTITIKNDNSLTGEIITSGERIIDTTPTQGSMNPVQSGGVFTELKNKQAQLNNLQKGFDSIDKYKKYVNIEMDYCYSTLESAYSPVVGNTIPFVKQNGTLEMRENCVVVKPKQIVAVIITTSFSGGSSYANMSLAIKDVTNDLIVKTFNPANNAGTYEFDKTAICVYENHTELEVEIGILVTGITNKDNFTISTSMIVQEIGRRTVIDPMECIDDSSISESVLWSSSKINTEMEKLKARIAALENGTA